MSKVPQKKIYIIRKYIIATSAKQALKLEKNQPADDCWVEDSMQKEWLEREMKHEIGFKTKK